MVFDRNRLTLIISKRENNVMKQLLSLFICLLLWCSQASAGSLTRCPNLEKEESTAGWELHGTVQKAAFKSVLIREARVMGENMVICKYKEDVDLIQSGNFQHGPKKSLWEWINLGGLSFRQCIATIKDCAFYKA